MEKIEQYYTNHWHWFERFAPYARSKFANVAHVLDLASRLPSPITINAVEPGMVKTDIYRYDPLAQFTFKWFFSLVAPFCILKEEEGAVTAIWLALSPDVHGVTGRVFGDLHEIPFGPALSNMKQVMPQFTTQLVNKIV